jgi:PAS domain S-box-containing protein
MTGTAYVKSRQHFHYFLETMDEGFVQADEDFINTYVNDKICKMLGYEREEIIGRSTITFFNKRNQKILREQLEKRRKGERGSYELTWEKKNGGDLHTLLSPAPLLDKNGAFRGCYSVVTDITRQKQTERALKEREKTLHRKRTELHEANVALKTLLRVKDESIRELEEAIASNIKNTVMPYLKKLKRRLDEKEKVYISNIESNLDRVVSPLARNLASKPMALTPAELQVAALVKDRNSSKEIASLLNVSQRIVDFHRRNIREKLGLRNSGRNLRTHLLALA